MEALIAKPPSLAFAVEESRVRLCVDGASFVAGPGRLGRAGAAGAMLFAAGADSAERELFAAFWLEEAPGLDWQCHFLCGSEMAAFLEQLVAMAEGDEEEEEEILHSKSYLTTMGSEMMDEI